MSMQDDDNDDDTSCRVGYSKPPQEHRFEKGRSGNPKGRPRKARQILAPTSRLLGSDEPTTEMILELGYRMVRLRGPDGTTEMPANKAIILAMQQKALKGDRFSQRDYLAMLRLAERDRMELQLAYFTQLVDYKLKASLEIARCKKLDIDPPNFVPHPDDIQIDPRRGVAEVHGPVTPDEKKVWDLKLARRDEAAKDVSSAARRHKMLQDPMEQKVVMEQWVREQAVFDLINDRLPSRYKTSLANRLDLEANELPEISLRDDESEAT